MKALYSSESILTPIPYFKIKPGIRIPKTAVQFPIAAAKRCFSIKAVLDSVSFDELSEIRNPAISTSYRNPKLRRPNQTVLDAQTKVCTGPTQTKPLNAEQAFKVLDTILKSGELKLFCFLFFFVFEYELTCSDWNSGFSSRYLVLNASSAILWKLIYIM